MGGYLAMESTPDERMSRSPLMETLDLLALRAPGAVSVAELGDYFKHRGIVHNELSVVLDLMKIPKFFGDRVPFAVIATPTPLTSLLFMPEHVAGWIGEAQRALGRETSYLN